MSRTAMEARRAGRRRICLAFTGVLFAWLVPALAVAQELGTGFSLPSEVDLSGKGWSQISNKTEMVDFLLGVVETTILTAALAFHPSNLRQRRSKQDFELPLGMFLLSLIGMIVGFLVIHHGYLIGFVVFGLGSLFRFRLAAKTTSDTGQLIVVTLVGLAVGLDLPVMALIAAVSVWVTLLIFGRKQHFSVEIKLSDKGGLSGALAGLRALFEERGFETVSVSKSSFKQTVEFVLSNGETGAKPALLNMMTELQAEGTHGVQDWHVE